MKKGILKRILAFTMLGALLTGCSTAKTDEKGEKIDEDMAVLEEFDIVLDWYPNAIHSFIYDAIEKGYYEEEGLHVNIRFPANVNDGIAMPAAGKADAGIYYQHDVIMARANENIPIKSIGAIAQAPLNIILSLSDKNIQSPKDLAGKTIGYAGTLVSEAMIKANMEAEGLTADDVKMVDVGFDLMSSMTTGNVDATIGCMLNHEVPQMQKEGFSVSYYSPTQYGVPNYYELVLVAGDKLIDENPDKLARFLRATQKGFEDMKNDPDGVLAILLDNQNTENFPLTQSVEKQSMDILLPVMETKEGAFLSQSPEVWQKNIDWLHKRGLINQTVTPEEVMETIAK